MATSCRDVGMTQTHDHTDGTMPDEADRIPTAVEREQWERDQVFARPDRIGPEEFPRLWNLSAGFQMRAIVRPVHPEPPEFVTIPLPLPRLHGDEANLKRALAVHRWNSLWEAAQFRRRFFDEEDLTPDLLKIADRGDINVMLVPRTPSRYYEFAPLYHLLKRDTCERFGLPLLGRGSWPFTMEHVDVAKHLAADFEPRLERAWAAAVWRHLNSGSPARAFSNDDPVRLLAHNLEWWLPHVTAVIQEELGSFPVVPGDGELPADIQLIDGSVLPGGVPGWPRMGGDLWKGEEDAAEFVTATVEEADRAGRLRGILDAVRSNRVEDDFSDYWSNARTDFERKLHHTRNKVSVRFVELPDNIPVQGPDTEVVGQLIVSDFMALLNEKERQIVVLLSSGYSKLHDIAAELGYATHSPISKKLVKIREQARTFFDLRE